MLRVIIFMVLVGVSQAQLPENPQPVADRNFRLLTSVNAAATLGDIVTTSMLVGHTSDCPYEAWSPELYGAKPSATRTSAVMGVLFAGSVALSYELKKHDVHIWKLKLWLAPQAYNTYVHASGAIHNLRTCQ